jgi:hypothetical protein
LPVAEKQKPWTVKQVNRDWARDLLADGDVESVANKIAFLEAQARTLGEKELIALATLRAHGLYETVIGHIEDVRERCKAGGVSRTAEAWALLQQLLRGEP